MSTAEDLKKTSVPRKCYTGEIHAQFPYDLMEVMSYNERELEEFEAEEDSSAVRDYEEVPPLTNWKLQKRVVKDVRMNQKYWSGLEKKLDKEQAFDKMTTSLEQMIDDEDADTSESDSERIKASEKKGSDKSVQNQCLGFVYLFC